MPKLEVDLEADIPEGWTPLEVGAIVKCLDEKGETALCVRRSPGLNLWEMWGMFEWACDQVKVALRGTTNDAAEGYED